MDHVTAMQLFSHYLEAGQSKGLYTIEDSAKIYNAQVVMNDYIVNKKNEQGVPSLPTSAITTNQDIEELKKENISLNEKLKEFEKIKIKLMSRNIELDNLRRNYNKKVEELSELRNNLKGETIEHDKTKECDEPNVSRILSKQDDNEDVISLKITDTPRNTISI